MRWQKEQMEPVWKHQIGTLVPAGLVQNQQEVFIWAHSLLLGESSQSKGKGSSIDRRHEQPTGLSALWLHKPIQVHPLIARPDYSPHSGSFSGPDPAQDRFETDAMLVLAPEFNAGFWILLSQRSSLLWEFF